MFVLVLCIVCPVLPLSLDCPFLIGIVVVVIAWLLDLQLPVQSVHTTNKVVSSNPAEARCTQCNIMSLMLSVTCDRSVVFSGTPVSSTIKTIRHHIAEILLKVALNTINLTLNPPFLIAPFHFL